jgi:chemotaxis protein MotB
MRKKRKTEQPENTDRWVVSYADFVTLLFAFFTAMYAVSHVDLGKMKLFQGSMQSAFKAPGTHAVETSVIEGLKVPNSADIGLEKEVRAQFNNFGIIEDIIVTRGDRGVALSLGDHVLFESGAAELKPEARPLLDAAASLIGKSQRSILIEGHTDNMPLRSSRYSSNLELSTARAARIFSFFVSEEDIPPERISASGYGEYRPVASNAMPEGRARNRRVDIIFVSPRDGS